MSFPTKCLVAGLLGTGIALFGLAIGTPIWLNMLACGVTGYIVGGIE